MKPGLLGPKTHWVSHPETRPGFMKPGDFLGGGGGMLGEVVG